VAKIEKIEELLLRCDPDSLPNNLIGAAVLVERGANATHSGIITKYRDATHLFHFTGKEVKFQPIDDALIGNRIYFLKSLPFIEPILLPSFLNRCKMIEANANPKYGYFYDPGSLYDGDGKFISPNDYPEFMTCVGFCINVVRWFLEEEFFYNLDWDDTTVGESPPFPLIDFLEEAKKIIPDLKFDDFRKEIRRILPIEYLAGAYSPKLPIRKKFTDRTSSQLKKIFSKKEAETA